MTLPINLPIKFTRRGRKYLGVIVGRTTVRRVRNQAKYLVRCRGRDRIVVVRRSAIARLSRGHLAML